MAHRRAKVLMPVGAVERVARLREERGPWHARQLVIVRIREQISVAHMLGGRLRIDVEFSARRIRLAERDAG